MYKLNLIAIVSIVAAVSFVVGMSAPAAFAAQHASINTTDNMGLMGNMTGGNATMTMDDNMTSMSEMSNATSMTGQ
jgi:hypothetical protein